MSLGVNDDDPLDDSYAAGAYWLFSMEHTVFFIVFLLVYPLIYDHISFVKTSLFLIKELKYSSPSPFFFKTELHNDYK
jgi:hypothetical protein